MLSIEDIVLYQLQLYITVQFRVQNYLATLDLNLLTCRTIVRASLYVCCNEGFAV